MALTAEKYLDRFATTTAIRVFNFIGVSSSLVERLFWIAVLFVFTATTVWNVSTTIQTFYSEPTASKISYVVNSTDGLHFDDAIICLEILSNRLVDLYEKNGDDVINKVVRSDNFIQKLKEKLTKIHRMEDERASTLRAALTNRSTVGSPNDLLDRYHSPDEANTALFTENEVALLGLTTVMFSRLIDLETDPKIFFVNWRSPVIRNLHETYVDQHVNFAELFKLIAEMTCVLMQIRIVREEYDLDISRSVFNPYNFCKGLSSLRYFGTFGFTETMCYRLSESGESRLRFKNMFDNVEISAHPESLYKDRASELKYMSIDLEGAFATEQRILAGRFNQRVSIEFSLETYNIAIDLRRKPCASKATRKGYYEDCTFWCRLEAIARACDCMPLFGEFVPEFGPLPPTNQSCALTLGSKFKRWSSDEKCGAALATKYNPRSMNCSRACPPNCERLLYMSTVMKDDTNVTLLTLQSTKFVYQIVEEYLTMDTRELASALGGNLSLWLGASFLALIHIVVFFVKIPFEYCGREGGKESPSEVSASSEEGRKRAAELCVLKKGQENTPT